MSFLSKGKDKMGDGLSLSPSLSLSLSIYLSIYIYTHTYIQEEITTIQKKETKQKQAKPETQVSYVGRIA